MEQEMSVVVQVLAAQPSEGRTVAVVQLVRGNLKVGVQLRSETTGTLWRVNGVGFVPTEAWRQGRLAISFQRLAGDQHLTVGDRLTNV